MVGVAGTTESCVRPAGWEWVGSRVLVRMRNPKQVVGPRV